MSLQEQQHGKLTGTTRRSFIRAIAAAGASTTAAGALGTSVTPFAAEAEAADGNAFSRFRAIAPSSADRVQVPDGFRADVLLRYGDTFADDRGTTHTYGYNNDFIAYFPLRGSREGLLFVNHEYPAPFFQYGYANAADATTPTPKTPEQVQLEQDAVGNSIVHVRRRSDGRWRVVSPSPYNRRVYGDRPVLEFTGPLDDDPRIAEVANGSVGCCSGGITPWGTALSCEENFQGYGAGLAIDEAGNYGWPDSGLPEDQEYRAEEFSKYGWVCEHDPYDPSDVGRKHTALGRFRHENTAFRQAPGRRFVLYMGDDKNNEGVYKFVSTRAFEPGRRANNMRILTAGTLYIARWSPEGRRRFATAGDTEPISPTAGTGEWVKVGTTELDDTATKLRARFGAEYDLHFATNRPEDVEVADDGSVYVALTNNSTVNDSHGSVRRLVEDGDDPEATTFAWEDFAAGGPTAEEVDGAEGAGFSSPDNLVFDKRGNLWVVTDISSSRLNRDNEYAFHANNALFYVPTSGRNAGVAFRFANMPVQAEGTGPYFTPDEETLFLNVQHPGEETPAEGGVPGALETYTSWWPEGNRTAERNPSTPLPSMVVITRRR